MTESPELNTMRVLTARLESLREERAALITQTRVESRGDLVDQSSDIEALIRARYLEERIAALELEITDSQRREHVDGVVCIGDVVTVDLGDGDETFVVGSIEQAAAGVDTITPNSPLGRAIVGATVGSTVTYEPRPGVSIDVTVTSLAERLPDSA